MVACNPLRHSGVVVMGGLGKALFALNLFYMRQNGWTSDFAVVVIADDALFVALYLLYLVRLKRAGTSIL